MTARALLLGATLALACAGAARADAPTVRIRQADQSKATQALLRLSDFGAGWTGGATTPSKLTALRCPGFDPKESDLVVTGHAAAHFAWPKGGVTIDEDTQVLATAADVRTDFRRTIGPKLPGCLAWELKVGGQGRVRSVRVRRLAFARIGAVSAAYRAEITVAVNGRVGRFIRDFVFFGIGRLEYSLVLDAPTFQSAQLAPFEQDIAALLVRRSPAVNVA